ncbi:MAG: YhcH/YjgK/YiaL family protein [Helicobacter sp.]|nr:YhcH/YjgK/YiaL family protein [Helicobacter sp.]
MELVEINAKNARNKAISKVAEFIKNNDISAQNDGKYDIDKDFFYIIMDMHTEPESDRPWESHQEFCDVHIVLKGSEKIAYNFVSNMNLEHFDKPNDFQHMNGEPLMEIVLKPGAALFLDTNDAHKTSIFIGEPKPLKKVVFKLRVGSF